MKGGENMSVVFFHKELKCNCGHEFIAVGNVINEPMTTGSENVIVKEVEVGKLTTTEGPKEDIRFKVDCPVCNTEIKSEVIRELV